jgi:hypothetical protein
MRADSGTAPVEVALEVMDRQRALRCPHVAGLDVMHAMGAVAPAEELVERFHRLRPVSDDGGTHLPAPTPARPRQALTVCVIDSPSTASAWT